MSPELRLDTGLHTRLEQRLRLAPQIIQSIEILQLPTMALEELILHEMSENPVLEMTQATPAVEQEPPEREAEPEEFDSVQREIAEEWREFSGERPRGGGQAASDRKQQAMLNTAAKPVSQEEFLLTQLRLVGLEERVEEAGREIILNLDESGYLRTPLSELGGEGAGKHNPEDLEEALGHVQGLEPPGVGARDIRECLLLQVGEGEDELIRRIISEHLEDIEQNRLPLVAKKTGRSIEDIKKAVDYISHLNPRPGSVFGGVTAPRILPDVVVEYTDKGYEVRLEDDYVPNLAISKLYEKLATSKDATEAARQYLRDKIRAARWLIDAIEQRKTTLFRISRDIIEVQKEFLDYGLSHLKPLRMQEVADSAGVHVSTVSRAIAGKYVQTPRGIFPIKYFFTGGVSNDNGETQTWRTVKQEIKDMVEKEDGRKPKSDEEIAEALSAKGYEVARRTVTKYRKVMGIPSSRKRRRY